MIHTREILFRGKRLDNGEWIEGDLSVFGNRVFISPHNENRLQSVSTTGKVLIIFYEVDPSTVGQATGLADKNGKMIFEGDSLKIEELDEDSCLGRTTTYYAKIYWDNRNSTYRFNDGKYYVMGKEPYINRYATLENMRRRCEFEVIDNPELIP